MRAHRKHPEHHKAGRIAWLRAAVLGANDGIVSTGSLIVGVAAAQADRSEIFLSGMAGLVAGAMSMAAGEYVSVSSQADIEKADLEREARELRTDPIHEKEELASIYIERGLDADLAHRVAEQLMAHDALGSHARDELGMSVNAAARPTQAALASAASFTAGASLPLSLVVFAAADALIYMVAAASLFFLMILGMVAAHTGGADLLKGAVRVGFWGASAMLATALIGKLFGTETI